MEHVGQTDLIRLAASELASPRRADVERHLAECPDCRALYAQQTAMWRALGEWTPDDAEHDLLAAVEQRLGKPSAGRHPLWSGAKRVSRIAAAVLIGVGVGYEAARNWPPVRPSPPLATTAATEQAAAEALGVEYFADASPAGLYAALPDLSDDSEPEEGRS